MFNYAQWLQNEQQICTGHKACKIIGVSDKREKVKLPDLSKSEWKYVFIQSTSRIRTLSEGMFFMYCKLLLKQGTLLLILCANFIDDKLSDEVKPWKDEDKSLTLVDDKHKTLTQVPGDQEYPIVEFAKTIKGVSNYNPGLGYGFYEFTKPELISYEKQVILMDKVQVYCNIIHVVQSYYALVTILYIFGMNFMINFCAYLLACMSIYYTFRMRNYTMVLGHGMRLELD